MSHSGPYSIGKVIGQGSSSIDDPELEMTLAELGNIGIGEKGKGIGKGISEKGKCISENGKGIGKKGIDKGIGKRIREKGNKTKGEMWEDFMQENGLEETEDGIVALYEDDCQVGSDRKLSSAWSKYSKSHA
jgi:hypothetical protein